MAPVSQELEPPAISGRFKALVAGAIDVIVETSAVPALAVELQRPGTLKIFAASEITTAAPFDAILTRNGSGIGTLRDLQGKKIGVFPGSTATALLKRFLSGQGLDVSNMLFVPLPPQNQLTALLEGSVDAVHAYEPTIAFARTRKDVEKLYGSVYAAMLDKNPQGVAAVSTAFHSSHPNEARATIAALEKAMLFMERDEKAARDILATRMKLPPEVARQSVFLWMVPHERIDAATLQLYADMLVALSEIPGPLDVRNLIYRE